MLGHTRAKTRHLEGDAFHRRGLRAGRSYWRQNNKARRPRRRRPSRPRRRPRAPPRPAARAAPAAASGRRLRNFFLATAFRAGAAAASPRRRSAPAPRRRRDSFTRAGGGLRSRKSAVAFTSRARPWPTRERPWSRASRSADVGGSRTRPNASARPFTTAAECAQPAATDDAGTYAGPDFWTVFAAPSSRKERQRG